MQMAPELGISRDENLGVARLKRRLFGNGSSAGVMVTSRWTRRQGANLVGAADLDLRIVADEFLTLKGAASTAAGHSPDEPLEGPVDPALPTGQQGGSRWLARWQRRSLQGVSYEATMAMSQAGYRSDLGFEERTDFSFAGGRLGYQWLPPEGAWFSKVLLEASGLGYRRNGDRRLDSARAEPRLDLQTPRGHGLSLFSSHAYEDVLEGFEVANLEVAPGSYRLDQLGATVESATAVRLRPSVTLFGGSFYGGRILGASAALVYNPSGHLEVGADYQVNAIRLRPAAEATTHLGRLRLQVALDTHASLAAFAQYNEADETFSLNVRARYHLREGADLWLVYDERRLPRVALADPMPEETNARALLLKMTYTFAR